MNRIEDQIQRGMVDWLNTVVPPPPEGPWWCACNPLPNKGKAQAGVSKAMGLIAGTPDLIMCWQGRFIGIEVKPPGNYLSKVQKAVHSDITRCEGVTYVAHSLDELEGFLRGMGVPMRGRLAA